MVEIIRRNKAGKWNNVAGVLAIVWMCVIFSFSAQPKEESSAVSEGFSYRIVNTTGLFFHLNEEQLRVAARAIERFVRKSAHMTEYTILVVLLYVWMGRWQMTRLRKSLVTAAIAVLYACSDELHQLFVAGRAGKLSDVLIDSVGVVVGLVGFILAENVAALLRRRREVRKLV